MMYIDMMIESMLLEAYAEGRMRGALEKAGNCLNLTGGNT